MVNRIIHIVLGKANPNKMNGINKVVHEIAEQQHALGLNVSLWGITKNLSHNYPKRNFTTKLFKHQKLPFQLSKELHNAINKLNTSRTIIHIHGGFIPAYFSLAKLFHKKNISFFFTPHGAYNTIALEKNKWIKKPYLWLFDKFIAKHSVGIQVLGNSEWESTTKLFPNANIHLIPNGQNLVDVNQICFEKNETLKLCFIGRIDIHTKGLDILMNALAQAKTENINYQLTVIGSGGELDALKDLAYEYGIHTLIDFKGALFGEEKFNVLQQHDALVLLSRNEGLPGVVLEAGVVGVPSIVSVPTNMSDYITRHNSGYVVEDNTPENFVSILRQVSFDKGLGDLDQKRFNAQKMVKESFNWEHIVKQLNQAYAA